MPHERVDWRDTEVTLCRSALGQENGEEVFITFDRIKVLFDTVRFPFEELETFTFNLKQFYEIERDNLSSNIQTALEAYPIHTEMTPGSEVEDILKKTIEGQQFLEHISSKYTDWDEPLNLPKINREHEEDIVWFSDFEYKKTIKSDSKNGDYTAERDIESYIQEQNPIKDFFGIDTEKQYSYVLRLIDEKFRTWKYVGQTSSILNRFNSHVSQDGDFTKPRNAELYLVEFEEVRTDISERDLYSEVCTSQDIPEERVLGGM